MRVGALLLAALEGADRLGRDPDRSASSSWVSDRDSRRPERTSERTRSRVGLHGATLVAGTALSAGCAGTTRVWSGVGAVGGVAPAKRRRWDVATRPSTREELDDDDAIGSGSIGHVEGADGDVRTADVRGDARRVRAVRRPHRVCRGGRHRGPHLHGQTPLAWGSTTRRSPCRRWREAGARRAGHGVTFLGGILVIALFYYPITFGTSSRRCFGWFEVDVDVELLVVATYLGCSAGARSSAIVGRPRLAQPGCRAGRPSGSDIPLSS